MTSLDPLPKRPMHVLVTGAGICIVPYQQLHSAWNQPQLTWGLQAWRVCLSLKDWKRYWLPNCSGRSRTWTHNSHSQALMLPCLNGKHQPRRTDLENGPWVFTGHCLCWNHSCRMTWRRGWLTRPLPIPRLTGRNFPTTTCACSMESLVRSWKIYPLVVRLYGFQGGSSGTSSPKGSRWRYDCLNT